MNFNNATEPYDGQRNGVAHHYTYGRHQLYAPASQGQPYPRQDQPDAKRVYFSSPLVPGIDDGPQTVEEILHHGFMDLPASEIETAIIQDKQHTSWLGLDDILGQIHKREEIYKKNMLEIEWGKCYAFNEVARQGWPATVKAWYSYQKRVQELHAEQRAERVATWRDIAKLREMLPESIQEYLSASRKSQLLNDLDGDAL